jgi:hypothetical protein
MAWRRLIFWFVFSPFYALGWFADRVNQVLDVVLTPVFDWFYDWSRR